MIKEAEKSVTSYTVYILRTSANTLYVGQTNNLERRLKEHLSKKNKSARYVKCFDHVELVYSEKQPTRGDAMRREREIRTWRKDKKEKLIEIKKDELIYIDSGSSPE